jgi:mannitol/fructose-specific phosphotransferase system IIA component (Ntr-type)
MLIFLAIINEKDRLDVFYNLIYLLRFDSFKKNLRLAKSAEEIKSLIKEYETALNKGGLKSDMGRN